MRYMTTLLVSLWIGTCALGQNPGKSGVHPNTISAPKSDTEVIRQIETDLLMAERTSDPKILDRVLADDYVNVTHAAMGRGKVEILRNFREHSGEAPPYSVREQDLQIFSLDDTAAVTTFIKIYVANENGNSMREDTTHMFVKDHGTWRLRISRESQACAAAN